MSLVFINNSSETFTPTESGAIATFIWECCRVARQSGVQPWVVTRPAAVTAYDYEQTLFVDYPTVPTTKLGALLCRAERKLNGWRHLRQKAYALRVVQTLRQRDLAQHPLMLHNDPEMAVLLRSQFPKATIIHHFHNHLECKPKFRQLLGKAQLTLSAVSKFTAAWVERYYALPAGTVQSVYNGVDAQHFSPAEPPRNGKCFLNFVGRTGREKAPDLLLEAAQHLADRTRDFGVQIVGSNHWNRFERDEYQQKLEGLAQDLDTRGVEVRRLGHVDRAHMPQAIRDAHIHVVPSRWDEPFGLTTLEGMACGLATVGSRTGGTPEIIGESGFLFERDSAAGLADQLEPLVRDTRLRHDYAHRARERAMEFSWDRTWQGLRKVAGL